MTALYSADILRWSTQIGHTAPIEAPYTEIGRRSRVCGSHMTVRARLQGGVITAFSWDLHLCAMGQATAGMLSPHILGLTSEVLSDLDARFRTLIKTGQAQFSAPFEAFSALALLQDYPARQPSALLPFDCLSVLLGAPEPAGTQSETL